MESWINLDRRDATSSATEGFRENTSARANFEYVIVRTQLGQYDDLVNYVGIDEKILAESFDRGRRIGDSH